MLRMWIVDRQLDPAIFVWENRQNGRSCCIRGSRNLRDLLTEEVKVLSGVGDQVDDVRRQLKTMHCFLKDASKRQDTDNSETIRNWVRELRDLATQAEIILKETESIRSRMIDLTKQLESISSKWDSSSSSADDTDWSRKTFGHGVEQYFVGMKEERQLLESLLTNDDHSSNQVISICGMGGLGKTSLARKVYQGEAVQRWFEARAWICISQQFQPRTIFQGLLKKLLHMKMWSNTMMMSWSAGCMMTQKEKKCLVILDDIWKAEDWNSLRHAFPIGESGSRILLTTRNQNIASTGYVHRLECLSEDEGWELLQKIALPNNYSQGRKPADMSQPSGQENFVTWARPILRDKDRLEELADPRLEGKYPKEDFFRVCTIAAACVAPEPANGLQWEKSFSLSKWCNELQNTMILQ
ncbi:putative disease resistance protein [Sesamum angolense]|uniref:Disease resistance protein n=1 Tax=Sesamum angolense TaxID=2727404 RepID=A0AAE1T620_9LAMI|nr:putative disease resistance protein [Sesamum angolense]